MSDEREIKAMLQNHIDQSRDDRRKMFEAIGKVEQNTAAMSVHIDYSKASIDVMKKEIEMLKTESSVNKGKRTVAMIGLPIGITFLIEGAKKLLHL